MEEVKESLGYFDIVSDTIQRWYHAFIAFSPRLIVAIIVVLFFFITSKYFTNLLMKVFRRVFPKNKQVLISLAKVIRFLIQLMAVFIAFEILGFSSTLWKLLGSLGVVGIFAGVALKDLVSSTFSGMMIKANKSFSVGHYVITGNVSGTVKKIGFLSTVVITGEGKKAFLPNQSVYNAPFYNLTTSPQRKIILNFTVPLDEDLVKVKSTIIGSIQKMNDKDVDIKSAEVNFTEVNVAGISLQASVLMRIGRNIHQVKSDTICTIKKGLDDADIQLISPQVLKLTKA